FAMQAGHVLEQRTARGLELGQLRDVVGSLFAAAQQRQEVLAGPNLRGGAGVLAGLHPKRSGLVVLGIELDGPLQQCGGLAELAQPDAGLGHLYIEPRGQGSTREGLVARERLEAAKGLAKASAAEVELAEQADQLQVRRIELLGL